MIRLNALVVLTAATLCVPPVAGGEPVYYRSNEIAMPIEPIGWFRADEYEYVLEVDRADGGEIRTLYHDGAAVRRIEITDTPDGGRRELRSRNGATESVEVFDSTGRLVRRERYEGGELSEIESMTYREGRLATSELRAPDGTLVSTDRYAYDSEGLLREVIRTYPEGTRPEGTERRSEYTFQQGALLQEWHGDGGSGILIRYDTAGRETARETWEGDTLVTRRRFEYRPSGVLARSVLVDFAEESRTVVAYDDSGSPRREERLVDEEVVSVVEYEYEDGLLTSRREETDSGITTWTYAYDDEGDVSEEALYRDGVLTKQVRYPEPDVAVEERFRGGELFLRIHFRGDARVREEVIVDGEVVQERSYE